MKRVFRILATAAAALLPLALMPACEPVSPEAFFASSRGAEQLVQSQFAMSFKTTSCLPGTRMSDAVTQIEANTTPIVFRGIERVYAIPFNTLNAITASDARLGRNLELPQVGIPPTWGANANNGLVSNNNSHLYENVYMKVGTSSVLVYGKAIDESVTATPTDSVNYKRRNGVLRQHGLEDAENPTGIGFELEPIVSSTAEASLNGLLQDVRTYLNGIAAAVVSVSGYTSNSTWNNSQRTWTYTWAVPTEYGNFQTLVSAFETLTGSSLAFSGSTDAIAGMLTSVYNGLYDLANSTSNSSSYYQTYYTRNGYTYTANQYYYVYELASAIRTLINNSTYVNLTGSGNNVTISFKSPYAGIPASYGVPDGAVAIKWNGSAFMQETATSSTLAPINSYCYPPSLWYWTGSRLKTSDDPSVTEEYKSANTTWADILANYTYGSIVHSGVASAAVVDPLQYGVAQLRLVFSHSASVGGTSDLLDSKDNAISINNSNFPFTGVLISEQKHLAFNFTPVSGDNHCVYDTDVFDPTTSAPKAYIAASTSGLTFQPIHTLVVQTDDHQDIHYALEFRNDSGSPFYGAQYCLVPPGGKFYLIGILKLEDATNNTGETINSVFVQDRITELRISINALKAAYNTIPELRDPQLEIGVQAEMSWVGSTPVNIPMY